MRKYFFKIFSILCVMLCISSNIADSKTDIVEDDAQLDETYDNKSMSDDDSQKYERKKKNKKTKKRTIRRNKSKKNKQMKKRTKKHKILHKEGTFDQDGNSSNGIITYANGTSEIGEFKEHKLYNGNKKYPSSIKITGGEKENVQYSDRTININKDSEK